MGALCAVRGAEGVTVETLGAAVTGVFEATGSLATVGVVAFSVTAVSFVMGLSPGVAGFSAEFLEALAASACLRISI